MQEKKTKNDTSITRRLMHNLQGTALDRGYMLTANRAGTMAALERVPWSAVLTVVPPSSRAAAAASVRFETNT